MNTHEKYHTVDHYHFSCCYLENGTMVFPDSELMLVECEDGRWYLEQEHGSAYDVFPGIVRSGKDLETVPTFYLTMEEAARAAFGFVKAVYPSTPDEWLVKFLDACDG